MGCTQSKIDKKESVSLCKRRKQFMKESQAARNLFAAAHSAHAMSLRNTGAALSDYAQSEAYHSPSFSIQPPIDSLQPPPMPPGYSSSNITRSTSVPNIPIPKSVSLSTQTIKEEGNQDDEIAYTPRPLDPQSSTAVPIPPVEAELGNEAYNLIFENHTMHGPSLTQDEEMPSPELENINHCKDKSENQISGVDLVEPVSSSEQGIADNPILSPEEASVEAVKKQKHEHIVSRTAAKRSKVIAATADSESLLEIVSKLDDYFLKAFQSTQEVSRMLESIRIHYHLNYADERGHIDYATKVLNAITWNDKSCSGVTQDGEAKGGLDKEEEESHAVVLDKLLAWEKKLYDEVKAWEHMKIEYQRKISLLNKKKKHGSSPEALEKAKAAVRHLHTRYIVDMQLMDETITEIQHLRDDHLYPKLVALVDGMAKMWDNIHAHHTVQLETAADLRAVDVSNEAKETSDHQHERTRQLCAVINEWNSNFQKLIAHQKQYIQDLSRWLDMNLIPVESSLKDVTSSPSRVPHLPIHTLLQAWSEELENLPVELGKGAISSFSAVIEDILFHQQNELAHKKKCEQMRKDYTRKNQDYEVWYQKYKQRNTPPLEGANQEMAEDESNQPPPEGADLEMAVVPLNLKDPVAERKIVVEALKKKLEEEEEVHQKLCQKVREKSLSSLKTHLPELFRAMSEFSAACSDAYKKLQIISQFPSGSLD